MARDESDHSRKPGGREGAGPSWDGRERRKSPRNGRPAAMASRRGRSGYGMDSIRPHLLAQLELQKLWRPTFPPEAPDENGRKGHGE
jgi:hypothetical protein